jgi:hypothetical protein
MINYIQLGIQTRELRSATKRQSHLQKGIKCHICREVLEKFMLFVCMNYSSCKVALCMMCMKRNFKKESKKDHINKNRDNWVCYSCRGMCKCIHCENSIKMDIAILRASSRDVVPKKYKLSQEESLGI